MKLSIITINLNNKQGLIATIQSVERQSSQKFEHVIVDGGSSDGSIDVIKKYSENNDRIRWVSEYDNGIYSAMNKGIRMAQGEYLLFLNSGDILYDKDVVNNYCEANLTCDIATGIESVPNGRLIYPPDNEGLTYSFFYEDTLLHQSSFIRKDAFERYGLYSEDYRIVSDWEWFFRSIVYCNATYQRLDFIVAIFDESGMSNSLEYNIIQEEERKKVHYKLLPRIKRDYDELLQLRAICKEYELLKNGKFGPIVKWFLNLKGYRKKSNNGG